MLFAAKQASAGRAFDINGFRWQHALGGCRRPLQRAAAGRRRRERTGYGLRPGQHDAGQHRPEQRPDRDVLVPAQHAERALPGQLADAPAFPNGFNCGDTCLLNAVYTYAATHKGLYPASVKNPGAQATMDAISAISGLTVNYYALIDLKGFQNLINAVGGVTIDVKTRVPIGGETTKISGYVNPGVRQLTGYQALWYARSRTGTSDYDRMARQRCVMTAMLDQLNPETVLLKFNGIAVGLQQGDQHEHPRG